MSKSQRLGSALSAIAVASMIGGCASPRIATGFGGRAAGGDIGVATRAQAAIQANDFVAAIGFAERAVAGSPDDAGFRGLLGNAYFGAGRFASAEAAYRDALSLLSNQPQVILKLALVQIAQGKSGEARAFLIAANGVLAPADHGLALALAGDPQGAIGVLEPAAREANADARVRQNLALAHALAGDWTAARVIAAQDLSADLVDSRIQQWMSFAKPVRSSDQVAALTGVTPAAIDPGQPVRLALRAVATRTAEVAPPVEAIPVAKVVAPPEAMVEPMVAQQVAAVLPAPPAPQYQPAQSEIATAPAPRFEVAEVTPLMAAIGPTVTAKLPPARPASFLSQRSPLKPAALVRRQGKSTAVVQLGAYGSPQRVAAAWNQAARRYSSLRAYAPVSARFASPKGLVYRLSVKGFGSASEANNLCASVRRSGGSCFVRTVAGDQPVRLALR